VPKCSWPLPEEKASLSDQSRLRSPRIPAMVIFQGRLFCVRSELAAGADTRSIFSRDAEGSSISIPEESFEDHHWVRTGVRNIGDVNAATGASGEVPDEKTTMLPNNTSPASAISRAPFYMVESQRIFNRKVVSNGNRFCGEAILPRLFQLVT